MTECVCLFCRKGPAHGVTIFRVNAKGQPGVWACKQHIKQTDATVHPEVQFLIDALEGRNP